MPRFVFVCYSHGTGGEGLAVEISRMPGALPLPHKSMGMRTWTMDHFNKRFLDQHDDSRWRHHLSLCHHHSGAHVVPSHYDPLTLHRHFRDSVFVVIHPPTAYAEKRSLRRQIYSKVWQSAHDTLSEKIGFYQRNGGGPLTRELIKRLDACETNAEIMCVLAGVEHNEDNVDRLFARSVQEPRPLRSVPDAVEIEYRHLRHRTDRFRSVMREIESRLKG